jgi:magnesium transporter
LRSISRGTAAACQNLAGKTSALRRGNKPNQSLRTGAALTHFHFHSPMFRKRYSKPGSAPATLNPLPGPVVKPEWRLMEYNGTELVERRCLTVEDLPEPLEDGKVRWIEMNGLGDVEALRALGKKYGLHPLSLEDVMNVGQRPKGEIFGEQAFLIAQMFYTSADREDLLGEQVSIFILGNLLISIQEDDERDVFEPVRQRIRAGGGFIRTMRADYLGYALLDSIVDHYFPVLERLGESLEELEEEILTDPARLAVGNIHNLRRTLLQVRRFVWPMRDLVSSMLHSECPTIRPETKVFLRDLYDHAVQIMDLVESYRDLSTSLFEMYLSSVGLRTNEIMRVLTVISSIFIPLTFIAGVYGMNFQPATAAGESAPTNMPELHWKYGYVAIWVVMILIAGVQLYLFRRKKWL